MDWDYLFEVKLSIKHVINLEVKNITNPSLPLSYNFCDLSMKGFLSF